jgi:hypothetical protein
MKKCLVQAMEIVFARSNYRPANIDLCLYARKFWLLTKCFSRRSHLARLSFSF